ncbi:MAG: hypothetical protein WKF37_03115 [Bryobacteraceae bacterium]
MRKIEAALVPGGRCATLDFVTNEDRVSPATPAGFALMMLGTTPAGRCLHPEGIRDNVPERGVYIIRASH